MSFTRIVAAVDRSPAGAHALRVAMQIATAAKARLTALRVVENPWEYLDPSVIEGRRRLQAGSFADQAGVLAADELGRLIGSMPDAVRPEPMVRFGLPAVELARWAEIEQADLLVLGRQPVGALERRPAGRTLTGTVRRARMPCLIVPFGRRTWDRVLAALGSGPGADVVLEHATALARLLGSELLPLHIEPQATPEAGGIPAATRPLASDAGREMGAVVAAPALPHSDAAGHILKAARDQRVDVIAVGYHLGEGAEPDAGGVGPRVVHRARCAVLTVPV
jgi:nucleotide-binding universal stress UspA family protein